MSNDKQRARRRARNSQAPDPFRRAFETDSTLRKSTPGEAPSSRRGASSIGAPSSRRGSPAAKRSRDGAGATAPKTAPGEDALDFDGTPASEKRNGKISERRPKTSGPDSGVEVAGGRAAVLPGDDVSDAPAAEPSSTGRRAPLIGAVIALIGVAVALLVWRASSGPEATESSTPTSVDAPAAQAPVIPSAAPAPPPEVAPPAPTATAATEEPPPEATTKDGKKKKKKKAVAPAPAPKPTTAPTAAPTAAPAFQFQFD